MIYVAVLLILAGVFYYYCDKKAGEENKKVLSDELDASAKKNKAMSSFPKADSDNNGGINIKF